MENPAAAKAVRFGGVVPHFRVSDVARTAEYYRDVLGFEIAGYWDGQEVHREADRLVVFGIVRRDQVSVHFTRADAAVLPSVMPDGAYDVYFDISDVDSFAREVRARGAEVLDGPADRVYGRRELVLRDCNGRVLAFGEDSTAQESTVFGEKFIDQSRAYLGDQYLPKIRRCVETIAEEDLWWRSNPSSNSIGNLLLHLAGNVRQWVVSGIGGETDVRERQKEFDAEGGRTRADLLALLENTLGEVDRVLAALSPDRLGERRTIQGREVTVLEALYHVVEHFGMHTGQIILLTKRRTGADLRFYAVKDGVAHRNW